MRLCPCTCTIAHTYAVVQLCSRALVLAQLHTIMQLCFRALVLSCSRACTHVYNHAVVRSCRVCLWIPLLILENVDTSLATVTTGYEPVESQLLMLALHHDVPSMNILVTNHKVLMAVSCNPAVIHAIDVPNLSGSTIS